jgi:hypothetical protein
MDFFNIDPDLKRLPPEETRIVSLNVEPYEEGRRIHVYIELTPFQLPPNIEFELTDAEGNEAGSASIIEPPRWKHELTMHIKYTEQSSGNFNLSARLYYPEQKEQDTRIITFVLPGSKLIE